MTALVVGYSGPLTVGAGLLVLIDAVATEPHWRLLLEGDGPDRDRLERHVADARCEADVTWLGTIGSERLAGLCSSLDVLVLPTLGLPASRRGGRRATQVAQGTRAAAAAAGAAGVPIVATDAAQVPPGVYPCAVVRAGDALALHRALAELAASGSRTAPGTEGPRRPGTAEARTTMEPDHEPDLERPARLARPPGLARPPARRAGRGSSLG